MKRKQYYLIAFHLYPRGCGTKLNQTDKLRVRNVSGTTLIFVLSALLYSPENRVSHAPSAKRRETPENYSTDFYPGSKEISDIQDSLPDSTISQCPRMRLCQTHREPMSMISPSR